MRSSSSYTATVHAAVAVLLQPHLLALVVSFQRGLPVSTGPLVLRFLRAHLHDSDASAPTITAERIYDLWATPSSLVVTHRWKHYFTVENIIKRGTDTGNNALLFRELASNLDWMGWPTYPKRLLRVFLQRARDAAKAFARTDVLEWLDTKYGHLHARAPTFSRFPTPLNPRVASAPKWRARVVMEAIVALDDSATFDMLRFLLRGCAFQHKPEQALRRCVHRAWEVAASCGRVDVLTWLYETYEAAVVEILPAINRSAVVLAVRHGHAPVLTWLESTFGSSALEVIRSYEMKGPVGRGHLDVVHWMTQRALGVMPVGAAFLAIAKRDTRMLRAVLVFHQEPVLPSLKRVQRWDEHHELALAEFALAAEQPDAMLCLVEHNCVFPTQFLDAAIARRDFEAAGCVLDHLNNARDNGFHRLVIHLVIKNDTDALAWILTRVSDQRLLQRKLGGSVLLWNTYLDASPEAMRLLLCMSPIADISTVLMMHALRDETAHVESILALVERPLPPDIVGFVHRAMTDTLGPMASLARTDKTWTIDAHRKLTAQLMETMTRQDTRDLVLHLLPQRSQSALEHVLAIDADCATPHCDRAFLELCLSLRKDVYHTEHDGIAAILRQRQQQ